MRSEIILRNISAEGFWPPVHLYLAGHPRRHKRGERDYHPGTVSIQFGSALEPAKHVGFLSGGSHFSMASCKKLAYVIDHALSVAQRKNFPLSPKKSTVRMMSLNQCRWHKTHFEIGCTADPNAYQQAVCLQVAIACLRGSFWTPLEDASDFRDTLLQCVAVAWSYQEKLAEVG